MAIGTKHNDCEVIGYADVRVPILRLTHEKTCKDGDATFTVDLDPTAWDESGILHACVYGWGRVVKDRIGDAGLTEEQTEARIDAKIGQLEGKVVGRGDAIFSEARRLLCADLRKRNPSLTQKDLNAKIRRRADLTDLLGEDRAKVYIDRAAKIVEERAKPVADLDDLDLADL